jgi:hypothetical protein
MAHKPKKASKGISAEHYGNLPTQERLRRGDVKVRSGGALAEDPLRIDKLLANNIIDEMQHFYGLQIITLWTITHRPQLRSTRYDPSMVRGQRLDLTHMALGRMSAEDQFYKTMSSLRKRPHDLIVKICFEEKGAIEAGRALGLPVNSITAYVRDAFDALGNALSEMRRQKKAVEEVKKENA